METGPWGAIEVARPAKLVQAGLNYTASFSQKGDISRRRAMTGGMFSMI